MPWRRLPPRLQGRVRTPEVLGSLVALVATPAFAVVVLFGPPALAVLLVVVAACERSPEPGADRPASFLVRSASVVLPPGASWVEAAKPLIAVRPGQTLTLV